MKDEDKVLDERVLEAWPAAEPPEGFADAVLAARAPRPRRTRPLAIAGAVVLAAAGAGLFVSLRPEAVATGTIVAGTRTEVELGGRGVAVAEPGAALSWRVEGRRARVEQTGGEVFYRVERGGPFVVHTPAADVTVKGTCFSVEVMGMKIGKQAVGGAAVGALITATVFVTVYEGRVLLANPRGATEVKAGERAAAGGGDAPGPAVVVRSRPAPSAIAEVAPPPDGATRELLLARDASQRKQLAELRAQVQALEAEKQAGGGGKRPGESKSFLSPTHDELLEMARNCTVQFDTPSLSNVQMPEFPARLKQKLGLTDEEGAAFLKVVGEVDARTLAQLRAIYVEVTGNTAGADDLAGNAMMRDIEEKAARGELEQSLKQISHERAGLIAPPANPAARPPVERALRILSHVGDDLEQELGKAIGEGRAHELRVNADGWPSRSKMSGCENEEGGGAEDTEKVK